VHEEQNYQRGFKRRNGQRDDDVHSRKNVVQVYFSSPNRQTRTNHKRREDRKVDFRRNDMMFGQTLPPATVSLMPVDEIQQREQKDPHNVDEVPIQAHQFHWGVVLRRKAAPQRFPEEP